MCIHTFLEHLTLHQCSHRGPEFKVQPKSELNLRSAYSNFKSNPWFWIGIRANAATTLKFHSTNKRTQVNAQRVSLDWSMSPKIDFFFHFPNWLLEILAWNSNRTRTNPKEIFGFEPTKNHFSGFVLDFGPECEHHLACNWTLITISYKKWREKKTKWNSQSGTRAHRG